MRRTYAVPLARLRETLDAIPAPERERSAYKAVGWDFTIQTWPSRAAMARSIRMQQRGAHRPDHWKAAVALGETEGY